MSFPLSVTMWASCCNWFCLDGSPEEMQPPPGARAQAYSNPGYSSYPSPTASEQSCKTCGVHFGSSSGKVSPSSSLAVCRVLSGVQVTGEPHGRDRRTWQSQAARAVASPVTGTGNVVVNLPETGLSWALKETSQIA